MTELLHEVVQCDDGTWYCSTENVDAAHCVADNVPDEAREGYYDVPS